MRVKDEADSTALDALLEIWNDWGVSKISGMFQTASQRGTILELSPGGVYSAKKTPAQKLSVAERLANRKVTPQHPNSEEGRCLLKSFVSTTNEEDVQFAGKSFSSPLSNTTGSGLVELATTDGKEIKIEEDIVEAQPSCSSSSSGTPSNPSVPPGQKKQRRG